jgi:hypothetical protein
MKSFRFEPEWCLVFLLWLGLIAGGYAWSIHYGFAGGKVSEAPPTPPSALELPLPLPRAQLLVALHPHCPCSRATVAQLARIISQTADSRDVTVLMYKPASEPDSWLEGPLLEDCRRINSRILPDPDGRLAASLGGFTSGHVVLYDVNGQLRYQGGITASRGHQGANAGELAVINALRGGTDGTRFLPVFGCPIEQDQAFSQRP